MPRALRQEIACWPWASATDDTIARAPSTEARRTGPPLALLYGALLALSFVAAWLFVGRALTGRAVTATAYILVAGVLSAAATVFAEHWLSGRPWSARFAVALMFLLAGPAALTSFFMAVQTGIDWQAIREVPLSIALLLAALAAANALYGFLTVAATLMLPLALPLAVIFAAVVAGRWPRPWSSLTSPQAPPRSTA